MSKQGKIESLSLRGPAGILEALLKVPERTDRAALLCHPHPLYQGSMHSPVVFRAARVLHRHGYATLRFNFRGVGRSDGEHDQGRGEREDVLAALEFLAARFPGAPIMVLGYSFGALVGLQAAAEDARVSRLIGIGVPVALGGMDFLKDLEKPAWIVQGDRDQFGSLDEIRRLVQGMGQNSRLIVVPGADHTFTGRLDDLEKTLDEAVGGIA